MIWNFVLKKTFEMFFFSFFRLYCIPSYFWFQQNSRCSRCVIFLCVNNIVTTFFYFFFWRELCIDEFTKCPFGLKINVWSFFHDIILKTNSLTSSPSNVQFWGHFWPPRLSESDIVYAKYKVENDFWNRN